MSDNRLVTWITVVALALTLGSCGTKRAPDEAASRDETAVPEKDAGEVEVSEVEIPYFSADRKRKWLIRAERVSGETESGVTDVEGVACELFEGDVRIALAHAARTHINYGEEHLLLAGDVAVEFAQREIKIECEHFRWDWEDGSFTAKGGIAFTKGKLSGRAEGVRGNTRGHRFVLF